MRGFRPVFITAAITAVVALLIIGGCAKQATQQPQQAPQPIQPEPPQTAPAPATVQQPVPTAPEQAAAEDDVYKDNLDQALDELGQLE